MRYFNKLNSFEARWYAYTAYNEDYVSAQNQRFREGHYTDHDLSIFKTLLRGKAPSLHTEHNWGAYLYRSGEFDKQQKHKFIRKHGIKSFDDTNNDDVAIVDSLMYQANTVPLDVISENAQIDITRSWGKMKKYYSETYLIDLDTVLDTVFHQGDGYCLKAVRDVIPESRDVNTLVDFLAQCSVFCDKVGWDEFRALLDTNEGES